MGKKILIGILGLCIIIFGVWYYNSQKSVECWWGVLYPPLSFVGFEEDNTQRAEISSLDKDYFYIQKEEPIKFKFAIVEWFEEFLK